VSGNAAPRRAGGVSPLLSGSLNQGANVPHAPRTQPVIGIVGGIGSGKSSVAAAMTRLGGHVIQGDQLGHEALVQPDIKARVVARWGSEVLAADGSIDRKLLGRRVFADPQELAALEALVFPYIERRIAEEIDRARARPEVKFIVLDAAIMLEAGWSGRCERIVFVDVPRAVRLERLRRQRGWSDEELSRREQAQLPVEEKRRRADAVIDNAAGPDEAAGQVRELLGAWGYLE
jgi:dephospho-CoA kinase